MRWFAVEEDNSDDAKINGVEITTLVNLLARLRNAWRDPADGKPLIYSVEVMTIFGQMIAEVERLGGSVFEWEEETPSGKEPIIFETWDVGDLVCTSKTIGMNPPIVGRITYINQPDRAWVQWPTIYHETVQHESIYDLVKVGGVYERFAPPHADADSTAQ